MCCVIGEDTLLSQCLSAPRVPVNCWGNLTNCREVTCDGLASRPGEVEILLAASCYRTQDKFRQLWVSLGSKASPFFTDKSTVRCSLLPLSSYHLFFVTEGRFKPVVLFRGLIGMVRQSVVGKVSFLKAIKRSLSVQVNKWKLKTVQNKFMAWVRTLSSAVVN